MKKFLPLLFVVAIFTMVFSSCSTSEKGVEKTGENVEPAPPPPAPGTAEIDAEVLSVVESEDGTKCKIKITKVYGYGQSTPHISSGSEHELALSRYLISKKIIIESGKLYKMLLVNSVMKDGGSKWEISKIY